MKKPIFCNNEKCELRKISGCFRYLPKNSSARNLEVKKKGKCTNHIEWALPEVAPKNQ